jgi:hypothetical protein
MGNASGHPSIDYVLSVDDDDPDLGGYRDLAARLAVRLVVGSNRSLVDAVNRAAACANGDLLIVVSDDFGCPKHWDESLAGIVGPRHDVAIQVHDGNNTERMTLPIVGRALYERLGYLYYPRYLSMFADDDLTEVARSLGALVDAPHLLFPHRHYLFGQAEFDATYAGQNAPNRWWSGWRLYEMRRATRFGTAEISPAVARRLLWINTYYVIRKTGASALRWLRRLGLRV